MSLYVGGRYISKGGYGVRVIERIHGDDIHWVDNVGTGRCSKSTFNKSWTISPDSPPPIKMPKRAKPITQTAIEAVKKELPVIQNLRTALTGIQLDENDQKEAELGIGLWQIRWSLHELEKTVTDFEPHKSRQAVFTQISRYAALIEKTPSLCLECLNELPERALGGRAPHLSLPLTECTSLVRRLQETVAPYLAQ